MYNHKRQKTAQIKPVEKMLRDTIESKEANDSTPVITDKLLEDGRTTPDGLQIKEKRLEKNRVNADENVILEKQMEKNDSLTKRLNEPSIPITDFALEAEKKEETDFAKENKVSQKDYDVEFWDAYVKQPTDKKVYTGSARSQLLSTYNNRKDFEEANQFAKKASEEKVDQIKDADAMLFHIYKTASAENRDLNKDEQQMVNDINSSKLDIMANNQSVSLETRSQNIIDSSIESLKFNLVRDAIENDGLSRNEAETAFRTMMIKSKANDVIKSASRILKRDLNNSEREYLKNKIM